MNMSWTILCLCRDKSVGSEVLMNRKHYLLALTIPDKHFVFHTGCAVTSQADLP